MKDINEKDVKAGKPLHLCTASEVFAPVLYNNRSVW